MAAAADYQDKSIGVADTAWGGARPQQFLAALAKCRNVGGFGLFGGQASHMKKAGVEPSWGKVSYCETRFCNNTIVRWPYLS
jgi:hypothetical protein